MYTCLVATVSLSRARADFFEVVERAAAGEHMTLVNRGVPRAMLVPLADDPRPLGFTWQQALDVFDHHQMDSGAWESIRFNGDTIGEGGLA
jgi:prevent-host-death family protein